MLVRTLLFPWSEYKYQAHVDKKETPETFDWISDSGIRYDYQTAKDALDNMPGSREYLKSYTCDKAGEYFNDPIGLPLLGAFGSHHSGASVTLLAWNYKHLLNNWDTFVLKTKTDLARRIYDDTQITDDELRNYKRVSKDEFNKIVSYLEDIQKRYDIPYAIDTINALLDALVEERATEKLERIETEKKEIFEGRIGVLIHHYKFPMRWKDYSGGSSLFGSPFNVTEEMIQKVKLTYPDYREHIRNIQDSHGM